MSTHPYPTNPARLARISRLFDTALDKAIAADERKEPYLASIHRAQVARLYLLRCREQGVTPRYCAHGHLCYGHDECTQCEEIAQWIAGNAAAALDAWPESYAERGGPTSAFTDACENAAQEFGIRDAFTRDRLWERANALLGAAWFTQNLRDAVDASAPACRHGVPLGMQHACQDCAQEWAEMGPGVYEGPEGEAAAGVDTADTDAAWDALGFDSIHFDAPSEPEPEELDRPATELSPAARGALAQIARGAPRTGRTGQALHVTLRGTARRDVRLLQAEVPGMARVECLFKLATTPGAGWLYRYYMLADHPVAGEIAEGSYAWIVTLLREDGIPASAPIWQPVADTRDIREQVRTLVEITPKVIAAASAALWLPEYDDAAIEALAAEVETVAAANDTHGIHTPHDVHRALDAATPATPVIAATVCAHGHLRDGSDVCDECDAPPPAPVYPCAHGAPVGGYCISCGHTVGSTPEAERAREEAEYARLEYDMQRDATRHMSAAALAYPRDKAAAQRLMLKGLQLWAELTGQDLSESLAIVRGWDDVPPAPDAYTAEAEDAAWLAKVTPY